MTEESKAGAAPWLQVRAADGHEFSFPSSEHALRYIDGEAEKWDWLGPAARQIPNSNVLFELAGYVSGLNPERPKPADAEATTAWLKTRVETYLTFNPAIHDRSTLQPYLLDVRGRDEQEAAWTICWLLYRKGRAPQLMRQQQQVLHGRDAYYAIAGMMNAWMWEWPDAKAAAPELLQVLARDAGVSVDAIAAFQHQADRDAEAVRVLLNGSQVHQANFVKQLDETTTQRREELKGLYDSAAAKMDDEWRALHRTYDEKLALAAPSKYWAGKQRGHKKLAIGFGAALGVVGVAGIGGLAVLGTYVFGGAQINVVPKWSQAITITAAVVLLVWTLKTLIRLTLSHTHLEIDANERRIMILSYLAMLKKADTTDEQRTALFTAIFRPTGNGLISDESVPVPLLDLLKAK